MWSGGISGRNRVRPAGKWARGLTCQTATTPACHIQCVSGSYFFVNSFSVISISFIVPDLLAASPYEELITMK